MDEDVTAFGERFSAFMEAMTRAAGAPKISVVRELLDGHLGTDSTVLPVVAEGFALWDHANLQVALNAYLEGEGRTHELVGLTGQERRWMSLSDLVSSSHHAGVKVGSVDYVNVPVSPDAVMPCVAFGLYLIGSGADRLAALVRSGGEDSGRPGLSVEVVCEARETALSMLGEVRRLMVERNVFRGQVISFGESRLGFMTVGPIAFHRRPELERDAIVLPEGVLEQVERHIFAIAEQRDRLRGAGQHVRRGLLLHGPPGTGKTLTARYVVGRAQGHTVVVLTGNGLGDIRPASALARMLQPSMVILEDVDLVAQHRMYSEHGNPVLFELLNEMDGMADDADVAFLLTTNRADLLEPALAARPGRVDLAVEIALPDDRSRLRLIELYARGLDLRLEDPGAIVARTAGVTASFVKELVRKAALLAALRDGSEPISVVDADVHAALDELLDEGSALTRVLLGGAGQERTEWLRPTFEPEG